MEKDKSSRYQSVENNGKETNRFERKIKNGAGPRKT